MQLPEWTALSRLPLSVIKKIYTRLCARQPVASTSKLTLCREVVRIGRSRGGYGKLIRAAVESKGRSLDPFFAVVRHLNALPRDGLEAVTRDSVCPMVGESRRDLVRRFLQHSLERVSWLTPQRIEALSDSVCMARRVSRVRNHTEADMDASSRQWFASDCRVGSLISRYDKSGLRTIHVITGFTPKRFRYTSRLLIAYREQGGYLIPVRLRSPALVCPRYRSPECCEQGWQSGSAALVIRNQDCVTNDGCASVFDHHVLRRLPMYLRVYIFGFL